MIGHIRTYCYRNPQYVKCASEHLTSNCYWKDRIDKDDLFNNNAIRKNDEANYAGCKVYKQLTTQGNRF